MNETKKTMIFGGAAIVLVLIALITAPKRITPEAFLDQGELFFTDFEDPNEAKTLEVIDYNDETGTTQPFKVTFSKGRWGIPSHHNYPADAKDRLAKTAAGVIGIRKDDFRTDNPGDHEACGVIDPLDETVISLKGRGQRVTLKDGNDKVLADFIVGKPVENREGFRFVRVPSQKRVYAVRMDINISTKFADWIESDLLLVKKNKINRMILKDYSINEQTRRIEERDILDFNKKDDEWTAEGISDNQEVDKDTMDNFLTALDELSIVGVRPKPPGLSASLTESEDKLTITQNDKFSLQGKGYFFATDGSLRSNEGELQVQTDEGIIYVLRFGEVVYGSGLAITAGTDESEKDETGPGENRYLFITTNFDDKFLEEPAKPGNTDFMGKPDSLLSDKDRENKELQEKYDEWKKKYEKGKELTKQLNERFAQWYYVISGESFEKLKRNRKDLIKKKEKEEKNEEA